jgi:hypothetical protein
MPLAQGTAPVHVSLALHLVLWPLLVAWACILVRQCRRGAWVCPTLVSVGLALLAFIADGAAVASSLAWPAREANSFILFLFWLAMLFSATAYLVLRPRGGEDFGGGGEDRDRPEPPWWPDFERQFRDYSRGGPTPSRPRVRASSR